eukprot:354728-Chlamydomonas_euryale.AAC.5
MWCLLRQNRVLRMCRAGARCVDIGTLGLTGLEPGAPKLHSLDGGAAARQVNIESCAQVGALRRSGRGRT